MTARDREFFSDPDCPQGHRFLVQLVDAQSSEDALAETIKMFGHRYGTSPLNYAVREGVFSSKGAKQHQMTRQPHGRRVYLKLRREP